MSIETESASAQWLIDARIDANRISTAQEELINKGYESFFQTLSHVSNPPGIFGRDHKLSDIECIVHIPFADGSPLYPYRHMLPSSGGTEIGVFDLSDHTNANGIRHRLAQILVQQPANYINSRLFLDIRKSDGPRALPWERGISLEYPRTISFENGVKPSNPNVLSWFNPTDLQNLTEFQLIGFANALAIVYIGGTDVHLAAEIAKYTKD